MDGSSTLQPCAEDPANLNKEDPISLCDSARLPVSSKDEICRTKYIIRKVDWRIIPLFGVLDALCLIDRGNISFAREAGMDHDLKLYIGARYSIVTCVYFVTYTLFQLPSNLFLRKLGVVRYLAFLVVAWGGLQIGMGFVPTWGYLAFLRILLGTFEAGFSPAMAYIISTWYTRHEVQMRLAGFYIISVLIKAFTAIFAYALTFLGGKADIPAWSWIFISPQIVEGAITVVFGIIAWFFLPGFPDQNTFLTPEETAIVLDRVEKDRGDSLPDPLTTKKILRHLLDWKLWAIGMVYMCAAVPVYAMSLFATLILRGMGWSTSGSLLLTAPPYVFAAITMIFFAWVSDKYRQRAATIAVQVLMSIVGLLMTGFLHSPGRRYAGIFLATAGSIGCIPGILAYSSNNIVSHSKRAVSTAVLVSFSGVGGIFASLVFRQADAPNYRPGIYAALACQLLTLVLLATTTAYYRRQNQSVRDGTAEGLLEGQDGFLYTVVLRELLGLR